MTPSLAVFDNFHPEPYCLRDEVLTSEFKTETGPDGAIYTGISRLEDETLVDKLDDLLGGIEVKLAFWRLDLRGELPHNFAHSDGICAEYAALLYLNTPEQCFGGTAFYTHKELNVPSLPTREEIGDFYDAVCKQMDEEFKDPAKWEQSGFVGMRFNRLALYPTSMFHGRWPLEAFGTDRHDGRLVWVCFFNRA
jgi:hypothetical protein